MPGLYPNSLGQPCTGLLESFLLQCHRASLTVGFFGMHFKTKCFSRVLHRTAGVGCH